jgi:hypothetical protein
LLHDIRIDFGAKTLGLVTTWNIGVEDATEIVLPGSALQVSAYCFGEQLEPAGFFRNKRGALEIKQQNEPGVVIFRNLFAPKHCPVELFLLGILTDVSHFKQKNLTV